MTPDEMTERLATALASLKTARANINEVLLYCPWVSSDAELGLAQAFNYARWAEVCVEKAYYGGDDE